jgi:c(7)-type cytochrome triheme protein
MNKSTMLGIAFASIVVIGSAIAQEAPADIAYECPNGNVTFSHAKHIAKHPACTDCHPDPFGMAKSELGMEKGHAGCGKCHKADGPGPTDVANAEHCAKCHVPPAAE